SRRFQGADVQPRHGSAAARARLAMSRRRDGNCRGADATRAVNFQDASHLPNLRKDSDPADPDDLPRQRNGITPQMHGRYPDYNVLDHVRHWDEQTAEVVLQRVEDPPQILFFTPAEAETLKAYCDTVTHQYREPRIPVLS